MHPAFSVIFLTTLIGVGQGLFLALFTAQLYALAGLLEVQIAPDFYAAGSLVALVFLALGLLASFFHLGHPERAWRAAAMWRTSWLSREVIALPIAMGLIALYGLLHFLEWTAPLFSLGEGLAVDASLIIGVLATLAVFALFVCTGMIYACLRFLQEWHSPLTVINFTLFGIASGFLAAAVLAAWEVNGQANGLAGFFAGWALVATTLALIGRGASLLRNRRIKRKSNVQSAIGVRHTVIKQKAMGFLGGSFNTREFFHGASRAKVMLVRNAFIILSFPVPSLFAAILLLGWGGMELALLAFISQYLGLMAERWYFFADASHPQNIYYQSMA
ncbi:MAG: dimethyl sulfoxide reductase anchor subunit [Gammaproteobacteria bacterium]|nr:dimethyl sulfoxide reductase anchor subunit [Gammaproteobacteria bacterium]